jgi:hypothetical protein
MAIFGRSKRHQGAYKHYARSYPWVGERIDQGFTAITNRTCGASHLESRSRHAAPGEEQTGMNSPVDVLIIGAGASGAAVAWSLADTRMHIKGAG